jgi:hypothetical protein
VEDAGDMMRTLLKTAGRDSDIPERALFFLS